MPLGLTGRDIPSFFILDIKVVRFSPSRTAAPPGPPTTHPAACKVCNISARWESVNVLRVELIGSVSLFDMDSGFGSSPLFDWITARSIKF